uniref:Uncharacterized protein n=1 Tax=Trichuris muris TaxID=70415 RepID=A0A5S6QKB1_TRIMR
MVLWSRDDHDDVRCGGKECRKELSANTGMWFQDCEQPVKIMIEKYTTVDSRRVVVFEAKVGFRLRKSFCR